ncbi:MAG: spore coat protein U domain-containing protein [Rhizobiales bacterium]|nr:spore coat protein U domain-containing protein [Hyphomicrobiales bacterium]
MAKARYTHVLLGAFSLAGLTALSAPAAAQTTDTLTVLATVSGECSVSGATLDFGSYTGTQKDVDVPISFSCTAPSNIAISIDGGAVGDPSGRLMSNETLTGQMEYQLFRDAARTQIWGVFPEDHANFTSATSGTPTVFGRIAGSQTPPPGNYSDIAQITLTTN